MTTRAEKNGRARAAVNWRHRPGSHLPPLFCQLQAGARQRLQMGTSSVLPMQTPLCGHCQGFHQSRRSSQTPTSPLGYEPVLRILGCSFENNLCEDLYEGKYLIRCPSVCRPFRRDRARRTGACTPTGPSVGIISSPCHHAYVYGVFP